MRITSYAVRPLYEGKGVPLECTVSLRSDDDAKDLGVISITAVLRLQNKDWSLLEIEEEALRHCGQRLLAMADNAKARHETRGAGIPRAE